ncbi:unnamed protein product [Paramecium pentaurelia]|uniref:Ankyrin repeat protein n=1 Tax=Paramecium pentaurelia TaxID=43138 RepID=A0A8S1S0H9_9CILI|nr:unnamed protein product [Paramecium pentaurelia]
MDQDKDLLTQSLIFNIANNKQKEQEIFSFVIDGKLTSLENWMHQFNNVEEIINSKDSEGKTPLFYACYYNFKNIVMYLLVKGADPFLTSKSGFNVFHVCAQRGHFECLQILFQMFRHRQNILKWEELKITMKKYQFKKSDSQKGQLINADKHLKQVQQRFQQFQTIVSEQYQQFLDQNLQYFNRVNATIDQFQRNPIHYGSLSKYTKCFQCIKQLAQFDFESQGWDLFYDIFMEIQLLVQTSDNKIDPRQYKNYREMICNFLNQQLLQQKQTNFMSNIKKLQKEIVNQQDRDGYTPMHLASFAGDFAAIQFMLQLGADPKIKCKRKIRTPLEYASNDSVRKYLMDLNNAVKEGDDKSFTLLVNCGQRVNGKSTIYGITPVHKAIEQTHKSSNKTMLNKVLEMDADVNVIDTNGWTPLHHAAFYGELWAISTLIERGAYQQISSNKGYYPIHVAALNNQAMAVQLLIEKGVANQESFIDFQDNQNCTPMHLAAKKGHDQVVKVLFESGANIYSVDKRDWTPLHYASFYQNRNVVHLLSRYDADEDRYCAMRTSKGQTADQMTTDSEVKFAFKTLWSAARDGDLDTVRKLVTLNHPINEQSYGNKFTPLILATRGSHFLIVKYLLSENADKTLKDKYGNSALDYAEKQANQKIKELLQQQQ